MELTTEATTPTGSLKRALAVAALIDLPPDVGVTLQAAVGTVPATVKLSPDSHHDHESIFRRLNLHGWTRPPGVAHATVMVDGVEVILHDVRGRA